MSKRPRSSHQPRAVSHGFTLIELIMTLSLFGLLVAIGLPSFVTWTRNSQVRTVTEALQNGLRTAQAEAVRRNRAVVLAFTNAAAAATTNPFGSASAEVNGRNWWIQTVSQLGDTSASYVTGGVLAEAGSAITIAGVTSAGDTVTALCFNSNGRLLASSSPGVGGATCSPLVSSFTVSQPNADRSLRVIVQVGGQIRVCDPKRPSLSATTPDGCPAP